MGSRLGHLSPCIWGLVHVHTPVFPSILRVAWAFSSFSTLGQSVLRFQGPNETGNQGHSLVHLEVRPVKLPVAGFFSLTNIVFSKFSGFESFWFSKSGSVDGSFGTPCLSSSQMDARMAVRPWRRRLSSGPCSLFGGISTFGTACRWHGRLAAHGDMNSLLGTAASLEAFHPPELPVFVWAPTVALQLLRDPPSCRIFWFVNLWGCWLLAWVKPLIQGQQPLLRSRLNIRFFRGQLCRKHTLHYSWFLRPCPLRPRVGFTCFSHQFCAPTSRVRCYVSSSSSSPGLSPGSELQASCLMVLPGSMLPGSLSPLF